MGIGSSDKATKAAQKQEAERQTQIANTTQQINGVYDNPTRQRGYDDFVNALRQNYQDDANRQKANIDRSLKFSLARSGLSGGSAAVDARRTVGDEFLRGILQAENKTQGALSDLKSADEQSRLQLIQMANSGLDATQAAARAQAAIQSGAQTAKSNALSNGLGDIFGSTIKTLGTQQEAAARRRGQTSAVGSLYGPSAWGGSQ